MRVCVYHRRLSVNIEGFFVRGRRPGFRLVSSCAPPPNQPSPGACALKVRSLVGPLDTSCHLVSVRTSTARTCGETIYLTHFGAFAFVYCKRVSTFERVPSLCQSALLQSLRCASHANAAISKERQEEMPLHLLLLAPLLVVQLPQLLSACSQHNFNIIYMISSSYHAEI